MELTGSTALIAENKRITEESLAALNRQQAEIDRLRAVNAKLVEALEDIASGEIGINLCIKYAKQALAEASK